jgi:hypothetical protein
MIGFVLLFFVASHSSYICLQLGKPVVGGQAARAVGNEQCREVPQTLYACRQRWCRNGSVGITLQT